MARKSRELAEFLAAFANELTSGDAESAVRRLSPQDDLLVVGTDQAEWLEDAEAIRDAFRKEAGSVRAQLEHTTAYEEDGFGWIAARGTWTLPDGDAVPIRWTVILRRESNTWKIIHSHLSVPADGHSPGT